MVSKKISQLPPASSMGDADLMAIVQGGVTKRILGADVRTSLSTIVQAFVADVSSAGAIEALLHGQPPFDFVAGFPIIVFNSDSQSLALNLPAGGIPPGLYSWDGSSISLSRTLALDEKFTAGYILDFPSGNQYIGPTFWKIQNVGGAAVAAASGMMQSAFSSYKNTASGLTATTVQAAIDEVSAESVRAGGVCAEVWLGTAVEYAALPVKSATTVYVLT